MHTEYGTNPNSLHNIEDVYKHVFLQLLRPLDRTSTQFTYKMDTV